MFSLNLGYNKRVAIVYFSAALLIVSVGVRMVGSLMSEGGQELSLLDWVMIIGIALEFFVLTYYSSYMWDQPDDEYGRTAKTSVASSIDASLPNDVRELQKQFTLLAQQSANNLQAIKELSTQLRTNEMQIQNSFTDMVQQLRNNETTLQSTAHELTAMEKTLRDFVEGKIKEQVQKEVGEILTAVVTQRTSSHKSGR